MTAFFLFFRYIIVPPQQNTHKRDFRKSAVIEQTARTNSIDRLFSDNHLE